MPFFYDSTYILVIIGMIIAGLAQIHVKTTFERFSKLENSKRLTGFEVARQILDSHGLYEVNIEAVAGSLTDHYDPRTKTVRLSEDVYNKRSITAISVAAHEVGHAVQDQESYIPLNIRSKIAPVAMVAGNFVWILVVLGLILSIPTLVNFGITLFLITLAFQLITLPVEFNASTRAINDLEMYYIRKDEVSISKKVLFAAALTYVAQVAVALLQLARLIIISRNRRD